MAEPIRPPGDYVAEAFARFAWALRHPFAVTPYRTGGDQDPEQRTGLGDLGHAFVNIFVETTRAYPKRVGKLFGLLLGINLFLAGTVAVLVVR